MNPFNIPHYIISCKTVTSFGVCHRTIELGQWSVLLNFVYLWSFEWISFFFLPPLQHEPRRTLLWNGGVKILKTLQRNGTHAGSGESWLRCIKAGTAEVGYLTIEMRKIRLRLIDEQNMTPMSCLSVDWIDKLIFFTLFTKKNNLSSIQFFWLICFSTSETSSSCGSNLVFYW